MQKTTTTVITHTVSPIEGQHIEEMEWLIKEQGSSLGEVFMFYGQHSLHGASTKEKQNDFLQLKEAKSMTWLLRLYVAGAWSNCRATPRVEGVHSSGVPLRNARASVRLDA